MKSQLVPNNLHFSITINSSGISSQLAMRLNHSMCHTSINWISSQSFERSQSYFDRVVFFIRANARAINSRGKCMGRTGEKSVQLLAICCTCVLYSNMGRKYVNIINLNSSTDLFHLIDVRSNNCVVKWFHFNTHVIIARPTRCRI